MRPSDLKRLTKGADVKSLEAMTRLRERATAAGLIDVAYSFVDSPFGELLVAVTKHGLVRLEYPGRDFDRGLQELADVVSPRVLESPAGTERVRKELDEYFEGGRRRFTVPVDLSLVRGFNRRVLEETSRIPFGSVSTYREVAGMAGSPRASRAAGNALGRNPVPIVVPCHRVVHSDGGLGGYTGGLERKRMLLRIEGALEAKG